MWRIIIALVVVLTSVGMSVLPAKPALAAVTLSPGDLVVADSNMATGGVGGTGAISPAGSGRIIKVDPNTGAQTLISSGGMLDMPVRVAIDAAGKIIVLQGADSYGKPTSTGSVLKVEPSTGAQTLISSVGYFVNPSGVVIDSAGNIIVADSGASALIKVNPTTGVQTVISSGGSIKNPTGVTIDAAGNLYVTSATASGSLPWVIIKVNPTTGEQTVIASNIQFTTISGLVIDATGNIFVTEFYWQNGIIKIPAGGGAATWLSSGNNFQDPWDVTLDAAGNLIIADGNWFWEGKVIRVNPATGAQTLVSSGGLLVDPWGVAVVKGSQNTITATAGTNGSISPSGAVVVNYGANQSFTITPNTGYHIADVLVDGLSIGAVATYTFTNVTTNHTIAASFAIDTYTIAATAGANGSISPSGAAVVNSGASQSFTITPNTGYHIADVLVEGLSVGAVASYTFSNVTTNHTIAATFAIDTFTITASAGANGSISPAGAVAVNSGANQSFTITPNTGYHIADVLVDGNSVGAVSSYTFTNVTANHTIAASFAITNQPPFALFTYSPLEPKVNEKVTFNASASYDSDGTIVSYQWNFGDEGTASGQIVEHTYSAQGDYTVTLTVQDNNGATDAKTKPTTVTQPPPTPPAGRRSLPDPSSFTMVGSGLGAALLYIGLARLRRRLNRG